MTTERHPAAIKIAARLFGIYAIHLTTPAALRQELVGLGLLPPRII